MAAHSSAHVIIIIIIIIIIHGALVSDGLAVSSSALSRQQTQLSLEVRVTVRHDTFKERLCWPSFSERCRFVTILEGSPFLSIDSNGLGASGPVGRPRYWALLSLQIIRQSASGVPLGSRFVRGLTKLPGSCRATTGRARSCPAADVPSGPVNVGICSRQCSEPLAMVLFEAGHQQRNKTPPAYPAQLRPRTPAGSVGGRLIVLLWVPQSTQNKTTIPKKRIQTERKFSIIGPVPGQGLSSSFREGRWLRGIRPSCSLRQVQQQYPPKPVVSSWPVAATAR